MTSNAVAVSSSLREVAPADDPILNDEQLWQVVSSGNLKGLTALQKSTYYKYRCKQSGLNPATQPYAYMTLDGVEQLYARKNCAEQLRKIHGVSIVSVKQVQDGEYIEFEVTVRDRDGREDLDIGIVFAGTEQGKGRANKKKVALTQAKRRATLSLCGEGILDESEVQEIPGAQISANPDAISVEVVQPLPAAAIPGSAAESAAEIVDAETGEILSGQQAMPQSEPENGTEMIDRQQRGKLLYLAGKLDLSEAELDRLSGEETGISNIDNLSKQRADYLIGKLEERVGGGKRRASA